MVSLFANGTLAQVVFSTLAGFPSSNMFSSLKYAEMFNTGASIVTFLDDVWL